MHSWPYNAPRPPGRLQWQKLNIRAVHRGLTMSSHAAVPSVQFDSVTPAPLLVWSGPECATPASLPRWCETDGGCRPETWSTVFRRDDTQRPCRWTAVCASGASAAPSSGRLVQPVGHIMKLLFRWQKALCFVVIVGSPPIALKFGVWRPGDVAEDSLLLGCDAVCLGRGYRHSLWDVFLVMDTGLRYWCGFLCVRPGHTVIPPSGSLRWA